jgi:hypothetical protein
MLAIKPTTAATIKSRTDRSRLRRRHHQDTGVSVHVLKSAAQYLIDLLDQWLEERLGIVVKRKCAADL